MMSNTGAVVRIRVAPSYLEYYGFTMDVGIRFKM